MLNTDSLTCWAMAKFNHQRFCAWLFIAPQLAVTLIFFIWPACNALLQSFFYTDAFGLHRQYAGFANFVDLFFNQSYGKAIGVSFIIALSVTFLTMSFGLLLAVLVNNRGKTQGIYKSLLIWPYAVA